MLKALLLSLIQSQDESLHPRKRPNRNVARTFTDHYSSFTPVNATHHKKVKISPATQPKPSATADRLTPMDTTASPSIAESATSDERGRKRRLTSRTTSLEFSSEPRSQGELTAFISDAFNSSAKSAADSFANTIEARIAEYKSHMDKIISENVELRHQLDNQRTQLADANSSHQQSMAQQEADLESCRSEVEARNRRIGELENQVGIDQQQLDDKNMEVQSLIEKINKLDNTARQIQILEIDLANKENKIATMTAGLVPKNEINELKHKNHTLEESNKEINRALTQIICTMIDIQSDLDSTNQQATKAQVVPTTIISDIVHMSKADLLAHQRSLDATLTNLKAVASKAYASIEKVSAILAKFTKSKQEVSGSVESRPASDNDPRKRQESWYEQSEWSRSIAPVAPRAQRISASHGHHDHLAFLLHGDHYRPAPETARRPDLAKDGTSKGNGSRMSPSGDIISVIGRGSFCNAYHLRNSCRGGCGHTHGERLVGKEKEALQILEERLIAKSRISRRGMPDGGSK